MSENKAWCLLQHAAYIPSNLQEKVPNALLIHPFNFHQVCGNRAPCKTACELRTWCRRSLTHYKLGCLVNPAHFCKVNWQPLGSKVWVYSFCDILKQYFSSVVYCFKKKKKKKICRVTQQKWRPHTKLWKNFWGFIFSRSFEESLFCVQLLSIILQQTGESFRLSETQMYQNINIIQQNCGVQAAVKEWHKMKKKCKGSFGWFFNHPALPSTVPQMLSTSRE